MDYAEAYAMLGSMPNYKTEHNTWLEPRSDGAIATRFYDTDIVTFYPDGSIRLNTGHWWTKYTKERMISFLDNYNIKGSITTCRKASNCNWVIYKTDENIGYYFENGIIIDPNGKILGKPVVAENLEQLLNKSIKTFEETVEVLKDLSLHQAKRLWNACPYERVIIAYYAPLVFLPLVLPKANGNEVWYEAAKSRFGNPS
jgi:hypothetical protein